MLSHSSKKKPARCAAVLMAVAISMGLTACGAKTEAEPRTEVKGQIDVSVGTVKR